MSYQHSELWKRAFAKREADPFEQERELFRVAFDLFRKRAEILATEIARSYPDLTDHGPDHLDALWGSAETVAGSDYQLTPAEVFVLGGAFLTHDLGNGLAAYPRGQEELRLSVEWRDAIAIQVRLSTGHSPTVEELANPPAEVAKRALESTLRALHARTAEQLVSQAVFPGPDGSQLRLFEVDDLRQTYGRLIGLIAYSHWWNVEDLQRFEHERLGPPSWCAATGWTVDALKVAALMRAADAAQIDSRRAPPFLQALRRPAGVAKEHWDFQRHLAALPLRTKSGDLEFQSTSSFPESEAGAWWQCYRTLSMVDRELRHVDALLVENNRNRLAARGVVGAHNPERLAHHIRTDGWIPVDARVHTSDMPALVSRIGGEQLYGEIPWIPLRELIQNAADAIRARRASDPEWDQDSGKIVVKFGEDPQGKFCEVTDDGVGMSRQVLTNELIDFGRSLWWTERLHEEFPGLLATQFQPTGRFGIGFFSVFMWASRVRVVSRRYDRANTDGSALDFPTGLTGGPILRALPARTGTSVRVWLKPELDFAYLLQDTPGELSLASLVAWVAPTLDVTVQVQVGEEPPNTAVLARDWRSLPELELLTRLYGNPLEGIWSWIVDHAATLMDIRSPTGELLGRATIRLAASDRPVLTCGGLRGPELRVIRDGPVGVVLAHAPTATRNELVPIPTLRDYGRWASEQARRLARDDIEPRDQERCAQIVREYGGDCGPLIVSMHRGQPETFDQIIVRFRGLGVIDFMVQPSGKRERLNTRTDPALWVRLLRPYMPPDEVLALTRDHLSRAPIFDALSIAWKLSDRELLDRMTIFRLWEGNLVRLDGPLGQRTPLFARFDRSSMYPELGVDVVTGRHGSKRVTSSIRKKGGGKRPAKR